MNVSLVKCDTQTNVRSKLQKKQLERLLNVITIDIEEREYYREKIFDGSKKYY